jgi:P27 family predicted phage terminase small subunit
LQASGEIPSIESPQSSTKQPHCVKRLPTWLINKPKACDKWHELYADLETRQQLDTIDHDLLSLYCDCWQEISDADVLIRSEGEFFTTDKGYIAIHPAKLKRDKAIDRMQKLANKLGIGVGSRKGLKIESTDKDALDDFLLT